MQLYNGMRVSISLISTTICLLFITLLIASSSQVEGLTLDSYEISEQLQVTTQPSIIEAWITSISPFEVDGELHIAWFSRSPEYSYYPSSDESGHYIYVSQVNATTGDWESTPLLLGRYNTKDDLRAVSLESGNAFLLWTEEDMLWQCSYSRGAASDPEKISDLALGKYDLVARRDSASIYGIDIDEKSIHMVQTGASSNEIKDLYKTEGCFSVCELSCIALGDRDLVVFSLSGPDWQQYNLHYLLVDNGTVLEEDDLGMFHRKYPRPKLASWGDEVLVMAIDTQDSKLTVAGLDILNGSVEITRTPMITPLPHALAYPIVYNSRDRFEIYHVQGERYPYTKVFKTVLDMEDVNLTEPRYVVPLNISPNDRIFGMHRLGQRTYLAVSQYYKTSGGMSTKYFSKLILYEVTDEAPRPVAILNPRGTTPTSAYQLTTLTSSDGTAWVAARVNSNGSSEVHLYQIEDLSLGSLSWRGSTPWYSSHSHADPRLLDVPNGPVVVCTRIYDYDKYDAEMMVLEFDPSSNTTPQSKPMGLIVSRYSMYNTWDTTALPDGDYLVSNYTSSKDAIELMLFDPTSRKMKKAGSIEEGEVTRFYEHALFSYRDRVFVFTLAYYKDVPDDENREGILFELKREGDYLSRVGRYRVFLGNDFDEDRLITAKVSESHVAIATWRVIDNEDCLFVYVFDMETRKTSGEIHVPTPKTIEILSIVMTPVGDGRFSLTTWGLDLNKYVTEGKQFMNLDLHLIDLNDPTDQSVVTPLHVSLEKAQYPNYPGLGLLADPSLRFTLVFTLYSVKDSMSILYSLGIDLMAPDLEPLRPSDGAMLNRSIVEFQANPYTGPWASETMYRVQVDEAQAPYRTVAISQWSVTPSDTLYLPEGEYQWTYHYKRMRTIVVSDWIWHLTIDLTAPIADAGGPYLGVVNESVLIDGSLSRDEYGIAGYSWTIERSGRVQGTSELSTWEFTPVRIGNLTVLLVVTDPAGNSATTTTLLLVLSPAPVLEVELPQNVNEGETVDLTCRILNAYEGVTYDFLWNLAGEGGEGKTVAYSLENDGTFPLTVLAWDPYGQQGVWEGELVVKNRDPIIPSLEDVIIREYGVYTIRGPAVDVAADTVEHKWLLDGDQISTLDEVTLYLNHGVYLLEHVATDDYGAKAMTNATITVEPWISDVMIDAEQDAVLGDIIVSWEYEMEPDFVNLTVVISGDGEGEDILWERTFENEDLGTVHVTTNGLPRVIFVSVILRDDSLVMKSNTVEIVIEISPDDGPRTDELSWTFAAILIIIIIVLTVALIFVLRKHRVGYDID